MNRRALVIGMGSIGMRHARVLSELGLDVAAVSRRPLDGWHRFDNIAEAVARFRPDYVVVANETALHAESLQQLAACNFTGTVLVEKPLLATHDALPAHRFSHAAVAYNLRFHPVLAALREALAGEVILSAQIYCGQYLPSWRPDTDYRASYSGKAALGGGVLRDLSHEIDYMMWLFGPCSRLAALGGKLSNLEIDSDDAWALLLQFEACPIATLQVNYLDRPGRRDIVVNTQQHTFHADVAGGWLTVDGERTALSSERDATYRSQHQALLAGKDTELCSLKDGLAVNGVIAAAEQAVQRGVWIEVAA